MKKATVSIVAGLLIILIFIVLNSLCNDCVYAGQEAIPSLASQATQLINEDVCSHNLMQLPSARS